MLFMCKSDFSSPTISSVLHSAAGAANSHGSVINHSLAKISTLLLGCAVLVLASVGYGFAAELVNINAADVESIASALIGIGPAKAQAIVDYREQFGAFVQIQDISNVPGIGDVTLDQIKPLITLGDAVQ